MNKTTSQDGTTIAFDRTGDGPPAIIVEGAMCDRGTSAPLAALLAPRFTVYAYDRRGKGDSGDTAPWSVDRELEDLDAIIREAGAPASVYGMSSGAVLGLEAAARGLAISRLALYEPPLGPDGHHAGAMVAELTDLLAAGRRGDAVAHFMSRGPGMPAEVIAGMRTQPFWPRFEAIAHTLVYDNAIAADASVLGRAATVSVPTLVLGGAASPAFLRDAVRLVADAVPGAVERTLEGQTHEVDKAALAPVLIEFFTS
jgi:pimeloyl-ACP methyl ester carboxylesterase